MSLDNYIHVVSRSTGEYSDRNETPIVAFHSEDAAKEFVTLAARQYDEAVARYERPDWPEIDHLEGADYDAAWEEYMVRVRASAQAARAIATLDPEAFDDDRLEDRPTYFYVTVPLFAGLASAGEAGTATTPESGVVYEHATAEGGDAQ